MRRGRRVQGSVFVGVGLEAQPTRLELYELVEQMILENLLVLNQSFTNPQGELRGQSLKRS